MCQSVLPECFTFANACQGGTIVKSSYTVHVGTLCSTVPRQLCSLLCDVMNALGVIFFSDGSYAVLKYLGCCTNQLQKEQIVEVL